MRLNRVGEGKTGKTKVHWQWTIRENKIGLDETRKVGTRTRNRMKQARIGKASVLLLNQRAIWVFQDAARLEKKQNSDGCGKQRTKRNTKEEQMHSHQKRGEPPSGMLTREVMLEKTRV